MTLAVAKQRIVSLDIFRGLTMMLMILVNNPGDWGNVYPPLLHAEWHGWTPTDLVFPFFVFAMGTAFPFAFTDNQVLTKQNLLKIAARSLRLISLGLFLNFFSKIEFGQSQGFSLMVFRLVATGFVGYLLLGNFPTKIKFYLALFLFLVMMGLAYSGIPKFESVRLPGVLQRLGIVYFFASLIAIRFTFKTQFAFATILLVGYWLVLKFVPMPGTEIAGFEKGANIAAWVDELILKNHVWTSSKPWDPEGVLSTLPAVVSCLIGFWTGSLIKQKTDSKIILFVGIALLICGLIWDRYFPINKALWSSSFVLLAAGIGIITLSLFSFLFDEKKTNPVTSFLIMWGVNPIIVFFGSGILPRALNMLKYNDKPLLSYFYKDLLTPVFTNPMNSSLVYALLNVAFWSLILLILKKNRLIIKV